MEQTQLALAGAAGITTTLFRAPYSSETDAIDNYSRPVYQRLGKQGYTGVFVDTDSDDWKKPGVAKIVDWATIYLWHEIALVLAVPLIDEFWNVSAFEKYLPLESQWFMFGVGWVLIAVFVLLCGWVEDVAAKKRPKLLP